MKALTIAVSLLMCFQATAANYFDSYAFPNIESATKLVSVERSAFDQIKVTTLCKSEEDFTECEEPLYFAESSLRLMAIQESLEQLKIFKKPDELQSKKEKFADNSAKWLYRATFLIPGLAAFIPMGVGVAAGYMGLYVVTLVANLDAKHGQEKHQLNHNLLKGSAGIILQALDKDTSVSLANRGDALLSIRNHISEMYASQKNLEAKVMRELDLKDVVGYSEAEMLKMQNQFTKWQMLYSDRLEHLKTNPTGNNFDDLINAKLFENQKALMEIAVRKSTQASSMEDVNFLRMLAGNNK